MTQLELFCELIRRLECNSLDYVVTGSWAMNYMAEPRATRDVDTMVRIPRERVDEFATIFTDTFNADIDMIRDSVKRLSMFNLIGDGMKFDIIVAGGDSYTRSEFERRQRSVSPSSCANGFWIVAPENLALSKLVWFKNGGQADQQQLDDVVNILVHNKVDAAYMAQWADWLDIIQLHEQAKRRADDELAGRIP